MDMGAFRETGKGEEVEGGQGDACWSAGDSFFKKGKSIGLLVSIFPFLGFALG